jgi:hypothetical protein
LYEERGPCQTFQIPNVSEHIRGIGKMKEPGF